MDGSGVESSELMQTAPGDGGCLSIMAGAIPRAPATVGLDGFW